MADRCNETKSEIFRFSSRRATVKVKFDCSTDMLRCRKPRRQKLETQFEELIAVCGLASSLFPGWTDWCQTEGLQKRFEDHGDEHFIISDLDVSQNKLSLDQCLGLPDD